MSFEIERKFLVRADDWKASSIGHSDIRQAYLNAEGKASIRIRIRDNTAATLTIKSSPPALRRLELEYSIPVLEAEALMPLRQGAIIEKKRYFAPHGKLTWEIDVFSGENLGLVIAEIELPHETYDLDLPSWLGAEITGHLPYYNGSLARHPFKAWTEQDIEHFARTAASQP